MCAIVHALFGLCGFKVRALGKFLQCSSYTLSHLPISILLFLIAEMANKWLLHCEVEDGHMCTCVCMHVRIGMCVHAFFRFNSFKMNHIYSHRLLTSSICRKKNATDFFYLFSPFCLPSSSDFSVFHYLLMI